MLKPLAIWWGSIDKGNMIEAARLGAVPQIMVFDCLQFDGQDVRGLPYLQRTGLYLDAVDKNAIVAPALRKLVRKPSEVEEAFNFMLKFGFEGVTFKGYNAGNLPMYLSKDADKCKLSVVVPKCSKC